MLNNQKNTKKNDFIYLLSDPVILLLDIYQREIKTCVHTKNVHSSFIYKS